MFSARASRKLLTLTAIAALAFPAGFAQAPAPAAPATTPTAPPPPQGGPNHRPDMRPDMRQAGGRPEMHAGMQNGSQHGASNYRGTSKQRGDSHSGDEGRAGGFHNIVPPGMWWKNSAIVTKLTLTPEQTKKMDEIFQQSRLQLIDLRANMEKQNVMLEPMLAANPPDMNKTMAQIDKVAQARAELEKADARMLLGIRTVLTPEQWTKLHTEGGMNGRPPAGGMQGGSGGPGGQRGPGGRGGPPMGAGN
jgi:Spy/CpxP family protein refolding chaperone